MGGGRSQPRDFFHFWGKDVKAVIPAASLEETNAGMWAGMPSGVTNPLGTHIVLFVVLRYSASQMMLFMLIALAYLGCMSETCSFKLSTHAVVLDRS